MNLNDLPEGDIEAKQRRAELTSAVMEYLARHPEAMDSARGIAEWWLMRQQMRVEEAAVVKVLEEMVDEGRIQKVDSANGPLYRLNRKS